jgi:hypothetical protein
VPNLLDQLAAELGRADNVRAVVGTVASVAGRTVTVTVAGGTVPGVPLARSYLAPQVGDTVLILKIGVAWLVLAALG